MCIIITKERNSKLPTTQQFKNSWESNPHGAGIAWYDKKTRMTKWEKGLMTYEAFDNFLNHLKETIDVEKTAMVFHFRITSKGETCPEQCHPFPVSSKPNWKNVKRLNGESEVVFAHNGTMTHLKRKQDILTLKLLRLIT
jgi:predicted glutamine amidotransferase